MTETGSTLEDVDGLTVREADGVVCLKVNKDKGKEAYGLLQMLYAWKEQADKLSAGEIRVVSRILRKLVCRVWDE